MLGRVLSCLVLKREAENPGDLAEDPSLNLVKTRLWWRCAMLCHLHCPRMSTKLTRQLACTCKCARTSSNTARPRAGQSECRIDLAGSIGVYV